MSDTECDENGDLPYQAIVRLPKGKTCGDCVQFVTCARSYDVLADYIYCEYDPPRFEERET